MESKKYYDFYKDYFDKLISKRDSKSELAKEIDPFIHGYFITK